MIVYLTVIGVHKHLFYEVEPNIMNCPLGADQLFADYEGRSKLLCALLASLLSAVLHDVPVVVCVSATFYDTWGQLFEAWLALTIG